MKKARWQTLLVAGLVFTLSGCFGGGGGGDNDSEVTQADITQAKAMVGDFRAVATSLEDIEDPADAFGGVVEDAEAVSGDCGASTLNALETAAENALDLYNDSGGADGTYEFTTDNGQGTSSDTDVIVSSPSAGVDRISIANGMVYAEDDSEGLRLNTVNLTIDLPADGDTSTASPLVATVDANVMCPESGQDAGITLDLDGTLTVVRAADAPMGEPTLDHVDSLVFDGEITLAQKPSATITNPVSISGEITLSFGDDLNIVLSGTLSDSTDSTTVTIALADTDTSTTVSVEFEADLAGEVRGIVVTLFDDDTGDGLTSITIEVTSPDGTLSIVADQFNVDGEPTRLTITDGDGGTLTIVNLNSDGPVFGTVQVNGKNVGTLEENADGDLIIRYADGTFETLA